MLESAFPASLPPVVLALGAAALPGTSRAPAKLGLEHLDARLGSLVSVGSPLLVFLATAPLKMDAE